MDILGKLFGSEARVRMLRLFFLNPDTGFEPVDIGRRTKTASATVRKELKILSKAGVIKRNFLYKEAPVRKTKTRSRKLKVEGWFLDHGFKYMPELKNLVISTDLVTKNSILARFRRAGKIKLLIISGVFTRDESSRVDLFIVGDQLKRGIIENTLRTLEAEAGKELRYAVLDTPEFRYRLEVYDKFVRDILDYPHETVIDRF